MFSSAVILRILFMLGFLSGIYIKKKNAMLTRVLFLVGKTKKKWFKKNPQTLKCQYVKH